MSENTKPAEEQKEQTQEEVKPEIELIARIDKDGRLTWRIPKDLRMAMYLNEHLRTIIADMHLTNIARMMEAGQPKKGNIITSLKGIPMMRKVFR
jgi:hypothetical protein